MHCSNSKSLKKFIVSYSEMYTQGTYYLASVSDKIYINPEGYFLFKGLAANYMFLKGDTGKAGYRYAGHSSW